MSKVALNWCQISFCEFKITLKSFVPLFYDLLRLYLVEDKKSYYEISTDGLQSIKYPFQFFITSYKCPHSHLLLLFGNRCAWCQTTVHDDCLSSLSDDLCDLGEFRSVIIPPYYLYQVNKLRRRHPDEYSKVRIYSQTKTSVIQRHFSFLFRKF